MVCQGLLVDGYARIDGRRMVAQQGEQGALALAVGVVEDAPDVGVGLAVGVVAGQEVLAGGDLLEALHQRHQVGMVKGVVDKLVVGLECAVQAPREGLVGGQRVCAHLIVEGLG